MQDEWFIWSALGVILILCFVGNQMYCYQPNTILYDWTISERWTNGERFVNSKHEQSGVEITSECTHMVSALWAYGEHKEK